MVSLLKGLAEEKIVLIKSAKKLPFLLKGVVRLVDGKGHTLGIVLDKEIIDEIEEETESQSPEFLKSLESSRRSGKVSGKDVKKKIGMK